eukprot:g1275.t1
MSINFLAGLEDLFPEVLAALTPAQRQAYAEFKQQFPPALAACTEIDRGKDYARPDDFTMLRFLQADKYDVAKGVARLVGCVVWRQQMGVDHVLERPSPGISRYFRARVIRFAGYDKFGRPLMIERLAEFCNAGNQKSLTKDEWLKCYAWTQADLTQRFRETSIQRKQAIWKHSYLGDIKGVSYMGAYRTISFIKTLTKDVETNFPECAGPIFIVNAPRFIVTMYSVAKRILDPTVASKIRIFAGIPGDILAEELGADVLPVEFGGTNPYEVPHVEKLDQRRPNDPEQAAASVMPPDIADRVAFYQRGGAASGGAAGSSSSSSSSSGGGGGGGGGGRKAEEQQRQREQLLRRRQEQEVAKQQGAAAPRDAGVLAAAAATGAGAGGSAAGHRSTAAAESVDVTT